jgi:hypothetical protein
VAGVEDTQDLGGARDLALAKKRALSMLSRSIVDL